MIPERLVESVIRFTRRYWVTLLLMATILTVVEYSLDSANWVSDNSPLVLSFLLGTAFGWMLATSRFSGLFSLFYSGLIAVLIPIQGVGRIIPPIDRIFSTP